MYAQLEFLVGKIDLRNGFTHLTSSYQFSSTQEHFGRSTKILFSLPTLLTRCLRFQTFSIHSVFLHQLFVSVGCVVCEKHKCLDSIPFFTLSQLAPVLKLPLVGLLVLAGGIFGHMQEANMK